MLPECRRRFADDTTMCETNTNGATSPQNGRKVLKILLTSSWSLYLRLPFGSFEIGWYMHCLRTTTSFSLPPPANSWEHQVRGSASWILLNWLTRPWDRTIHGASQINLVIPFRVEPRTVETSFRWTELANEWPLLLALWILTKMNERE